MYIPDHFRASDDVVRELLDRHGAGDLVTATAGGLLATHLPFVFDPEVGSSGALLGHVARANDHWRRDVIGEALAIVRGPEAYVSPSWYPSKAEHGRVVPTWNYLTVHVYGDLVIHDDVIWVESLVRRLTEKHESGRVDSWSIDDAPRPFIEAQLRGIVGLELRITHVEGKAKWSQNRSESDRRGVADGLDADGRHLQATAVRQRRDP
jgi:transcriptional regulator